VQPQILVVTDPPHRSVDVEAAAALLGLDVEDARLKIGYGAPEVLSAADAGPAVDFAKSLRDVGLNVAVIHGSDLSRIPWPAPVASFTFGVDGLTLCFSGGDVEISYDTPVLGVYCSPPTGRGTGDDTAAARQATGQPGGGPAIAEAIEWMANFDLYFEQAGALQRISIVQDLVDFSGLADLQQATAAANMSVTVSACRRYFRQIDVDTRLENVRPRQRFVMGEQGFDLDLRKMYSFGTLLLRQALDAVSPELKDLTQYELGSRLAYVLHRQRG
jgi:hypothetical protein